MPSTVPSGQSSAGRLRSRLAKDKACTGRPSGEVPGASLTVKVLPDCNHDTLTCTTGDFKEGLVRREVCAGYYDTLLGWLKDKGSSEHHGVTALHAGMYEKSPQDAGFIVWSGREYIYPLKPALELWSRNCVAFPRVRNVVKVFD